MVLKILFIGWFKEWSKDIVEPSTELIGTGFDSNTPHLEYEFYEHIAIHNIIRKVVIAEKEGFNAVVIGCFYDPGLREARELVKIPVVGVCEASLHVASMISAGKYNVLVGRKKWIPKMADNARNYGFESKIATWRVLNLTVPEMRDVDKTVNAIIRESKKSKELDLAECVVLGCTGMAGLAKKASQEVGIPILDPVLMGVRMAEFRGTLWKRYGISHSKIGGYEAPPEEEFNELFKSVYGDSKKL
jgi:allantoin racemase